MESNEPGPSRRTVLVASGAVVVGAGVLAGCSSDSAEPSATAGQSTPGTPDDTTDVPNDTNVLAKTSDVAVGDAVFVESRGIVVSQPKEGSFFAFDGRCPHQGCSVSATQASDLLCPCHGSLFNAESGDVQRGPATTGLPKVAITVKDGEIHTA